MSLARLLGSAATNSIQPFWLSSLDPQDMHEDTAPGSTNRDPSPHYSSLHSSELLSAQLGFNTPTPYYCLSISDKAFVMEESQKDPHRPQYVTSSPEMASTPPNPPPGCSCNLLCVLFFCLSMRVEQREMRDSMPPLVAMRERGNTFSITSIHSSRAFSSSLSFLFLSS